MLNGGMLNGGMLEGATAELTGATRIAATITVNGKSYAREIEPRTLLVEFLREACDLTGTHVGCDTSYCGACTVLMNGLAVKSCTVLAVQADGAEITTVEGLEKDAQLGPIQKAFGKCYGLQCGYCTPGLMLATQQLLSNNPEPSDKEIRKAIAGNACRCTGYVNVFKAIQLAGRYVKGA
jgi:aerobic carbon-monoxide dehydrogenase small subunit